MASVISACQEMMFLYSIQKTLNNFIWSRPIPQYPTASKKTRAEHLQAILLNFTHISNSINHITSLEPLKICYANELRVHKKMNPQLICISNLNLLSKYHDNFFS